MIRDVTIFLEHADWFVGKKLDECLYPAEIVAQMRTEAKMETLPAEEIITNWSWT